MRECEVGGEGICESAIAVGGGGVRGKEEGLEEVWAVGEVLEVCNAGGDVRRQFFLRKYGRGRQTSKTVKSEVCTVGLGEVVVTVGVVRRTVKVLDCGEGGRTGGKVCWCGMWGRWRLERALAVGGVVEVLTFWAVVGGELGSSLEVRWGACSELPRMGG